MKIITNVFKSPAPISVKIIAWYFLLDGAANIVYEIVSQSVRFNYSLLSGWRFFNQSLPGIVASDPFSHGVVVATPLYDNVSILLKSLSIIAILLFAGYKLLCMDRRGWFSGIYIVAFGLLFSTIIYNNPVSYIENILGGIRTYGVISEWTVMGIAFLINVFALFYLPMNKKLFENQAVSGQKNTFKDYVLIALLLIVILPLPQIISRLFPSSDNSVTSPITQSLSAKPEDVVKTFYNTWLNCESEFNKYALKTNNVPQEIRDQREKCIKDVINKYTSYPQQETQSTKRWCAQDLPSKVEVDKSNITNQTATVISHHFFESSGDNQIKVFLTLSDNEWKISGTTCLNPTFHTSDWKQYNSVDGKYSIKYPKEYKMYENKYPSVDGVWNTTPNTFGLDSSKFQFIVQYKNVGVNKSLDELVNKYSNCTSITATTGKLYYIGEKSEIKGYIYADNPCGPVGSSNWYFYTKEIFYSISLIGDTYENNAGLINQIIGSIRFQD